MTKKKLIADQRRAGAKSSRQGCDPAGAGRRKPLQVLSCQLSGFGHVAMPQLVSGNGASTARCIRPYGQRETSGQSSRRVEQVWEPEDKRMVAASRNLACGKLLAGDFSRAEFLSRKMRPM